MPKPGAPVRRARALAACLAVSMAASAPVVAPAAEAAPEWVYVQRDDDAGLELVLRAPEPEADGAGWRVPGFAGVGEPGLPVLAEASLIVGVPGPGGAEL